MMRIKFQQNVQVKRTKKKESFMQRRWTIHKSWYRATHDEFTLGNIVIEYKRRVLS